MLAMIIERLTASYAMFKQFAVGTVIELRGHNLEHFVDRLIRPSLTVGAGHDPHQEVLTP